MPEATGTKAKRGSGRAYVALLRGVNVGGRNKLPMKALVEVFVQAGCEDVRTYIQSGNVVFRAAAGTAKGLPGVVAKEIRKRFGIESPVVVRSAEELERAIEENPFAGAGADPAAMHVAFLATKPKRAAVEKLDPERSPGDAFEAVGMEVYLHLPNGVARTKLTNAYFDQALGTVSTMRNWRTVLKLAEMARSGE